MIMTPYISMNCSVVEALFDAASFRRRDARTINFAFRRNQRRSRSASVTTMISDEGVHIDIFPWSANPRVDTQRIDLPDRRLRTITQLTGRVTAVKPDF